MNTVGKLYKLKSGQLIHVAIISEEEYPLSTISDLSWKSWLKAHNLTDPKHIDLKDVDTILYKSDTCIASHVAYIEQELKILQTEVLNGDTTKLIEFDKRKQIFQQSIYSDIFVLVEKIKLGLKALHYHSLFGITNIPTDGISVNTASEGQVVSGVSEYN